MTITWGRLLVALAILIVLVLAAGLMTYGISNAICGDAARLALDGCVPD